LGTRNAIKVRTRKKTQSGGGNWTKLQEAEMPGEKKELTDNHSRTRRGKNDRIWGPCPPKKGTRKGWGQKKR